jgi:hypothetical protein
MSRVAHFNAQMLIEGALSEAMRVTGESIVKYLGYSNFVRLGGP